MRELRRCPFCGGEANIQEDNLFGTFIPYCPNCLTQKGRFSSRESAIEAWNRREPMDRIIKQLEEYKNLECDDIDEDIDQEAEDAEELYDIGRSQGKLEAYLNAIEIVKSGGAV